MKIKLLVTLTWSKIMAFVMLICAVFLELYFKSEGKIFMFSVPFIAGLIGWKQYQDSKNENNKGVAD